MCGTICEVYDHPYLDLFVTGANTKLPLYVSPVSVAFQHCWDDLIFCVSPLRSSKRGLVVSSAFDRSLNYPGTSFVATGVVCRPTASSDGRSSQALHALEVSCSASSEEVSQWLWVTSFLYVEVIK